MQQYKSIVARRINRLTGVTGNAVWQRNYWEHVSRDGKDLDRIRAYIRDNPLHWTDDEKTPHRS